MARVAVLTMSDGRDFVARDLTGYCREAEDAVAATLVAAGHQVERGGEPVSTSDVATSSARRLAASQPDLTIFHYPVWAFPHFTMLAASATSRLLLLLGSIDPVYPGMVGMLAAGGALDQIGRTHVRAWGSITDPDALRRVLGYVSAGHAVSQLRGSTFGRIGGRPMGMYTAVANADQWIDTFGVDVEEIDQWELVRRSESVSAKRVGAAADWLERVSAGVHSDAGRARPVGGAADFVRADLDGSSAASRALVAAATSRLGQLDILVNKRRDLPSGHDSHRRRRHGRPHLRCQRQGTVLPHSGGRAWHHRGRPRRDHQPRLLGGPAECPRRRPLRLHQRRDGDAHPSLGCRIRPPLPST
jgi:L-fucose isomerase, first N-terminal domain